MASRRRSPRLYPNLASELNEEEQDATVDVTEDDSFETSEGEEVQYADEHYQHDRDIRTRRGAARPRASSPSSSSRDTFLHTAGPQLARLREQLYGRADHSNAGDTSWQESFANNIRELSVAAVIIFLIIYLLLAGPSGRTVEKPLEIYMQGLKKMHNRFGAQDRQSWVTLRTAGTLVFNTSHITEPAVVLLAGDPSTVGCFAQDLAAAALSSYGLDGTDPTYTIINGASYRSLNAAAAKKALENVLRGFLSKMSVATLLALESLPGDSPLMLHTYCDHENAPFKDAFIILSTSLDTESAVGWNGCDAAVHAALRQRWKAENGLNEDKIGALLARIANLVVCVRPQPDITC